MKETVEVRKIIMSSSDNNDSAKNRYNAARRAKRVAQSKDERAECNRKHREVMHTWRVKRKKTETSTQRAARLAKRVAADHARKAKHTLAQREEQRKRDRARYLRRRELCADVKRHAAQLAQRRARPRRLAKQAATRAVAPSRHALHDSLHNKRRACKRRASRARIARSGVADVRDLTERRPRRLANLAATRAAAPSRMPTRTRGTRTLVRIAANERRTTSRHDASARKTDAQVRAIRVHQLSWVVGQQAPKTLAQVHAIHKRQRLWSQWSEANDTRGRASRHL